MRSWFLAQRCIGVDGGNKLATEDTDIRKPEKLTDLAKWTKFWELLTTYLGRVKSAALTPLSYLIWEHEEVTQDHHDADYQSVQERLIATTALNGTHFDLENTIVHCTMYSSCLWLMNQGGASSRNSTDLRMDEARCLLSSRRQKGLLRS